MADENTGLSEQQVEDALYRVQTGEIKPGDRVKVTWYETIDLKDELEELGVSFEEDYEYIFVKVSGLGYRVVRHPTKIGVVFALDPRDSMEKLDS